MLTTPQPLDDRNRFAFGENWARFLTILTDERVAEAEASLKEMLGVETLAGRSFLDVGCGSGLFSLAARRLGARAYSFDYDPNSVACTAELKRRYFAEDPDWQIQQGSALDKEFLDGLGQFDIVYSWGALHHTGAMWLGIELALQRVASNGTLFIAIYNDQDLKSRIWWIVKYVYNALPKPLALAYAYVFGFLGYALNLIKYTLMLKPMVAVRQLLDYQKNRGMSLSHDLVDWMGGFPFEFARHDVLAAFLKARGFQVVKSKVATSLGCHELVARRTPH